MALLWGLKFIFQALEFAFDVGGRLRKEVSMWKEEASAEKGSGVVYFWGLS